jgi:isoleucyl-tRNA synthetase
MPFLTEAMYQNLVVAGCDSSPSSLGGEGRGGEALASSPPTATLSHKEGGSPRPISVHLCDYPQVDESLIDAQLSADMDALLRLVSLGSAARDSVKIKRRQPLAELRVRPGTDAERRAVERFADQLRDELNVKQVTLHDPAAGPLLTPEVKPNAKALGPKFGPRLREVQAAIAAASPAELAAKVQASETIDLGDFTLEPADLVVTQTAPPGWAGVADRETQVLLDTRLTDGLRLEGMAREVVRHVQEARKEAGLEMEERIVLALLTEAPELRRAMDATGDYIAGETLVVERAAGPLAEALLTKPVKIDGQALTIQLARA